MYVCVCVYVKYVSYKYTTGLEEVTLKQGTLFLWDTIDYQIKSALLEWVLSLWAVSGVPQIPPKPSRQLTLISVTFQNLWKGRVAEDIIIPES